MNARPKVGLLGLGWIGRARLKSLAEANLVDIVALADPSQEALVGARAHAPQARLCANVDELLASQLDGLHARACLAAFERGVAVFCQKPLARDTAETEQVVESARRADRLLRVDLCYRHTSALGALRAVVQQGRIGKVYAAELTFHNAYGPDKAWARDLSLAGGGCLVDLGVHLIDAAFWVLGEGQLAQANARLFAHGKPLGPRPNEVEDFAVGHLDLADRTRLSIACSWQSSFGNHARIRVALFGDRGGAAFENVSGSFYDFTCEVFHGSARERVYAGAEEWGGRAIVSWAEELVQSPRYRADSSLLRVSQALDALYGRSLVIPLSGPETGSASTSVRAVS